MVELKTVQLEDKRILWNILQKYLYELSGYYGDVIQQDGDYQYRYFDSYFEENESDSIFAKFVFLGEELVGFALINTYSYNENIIDYSLAEFTIFPTYRGKNVVEKALDMIFDEMPGTWQLKYTPINQRGTAFWTKTIGKFNPEKYEIDDEILLEFCTVNRKNDEEKTNGFTVD